MQIDYLAFLEKVVNKTVLYLKKNQLRITSDISNLFLNMFTGGLNLISCFILSTFCLGLVKKGFEIKKDDEDTKDMTNTIAGLAMLIKTTYNLEGGCDQIALDNLDIYLDEIKTKTNVFIKKNNEAKHE
jgi:hypothetical protein